MSREADVLLSTAMDFLTKAAKEEDKSGSLGEASKSATDALDLCKSAGDAKGEANAMSVLALVSAADGKPKDGIVTAEKAAVIFEELGEKELMAKEVSSMARWYLEVDNPRKALYYSQEALDVMMELGLPHFEQVDTLGFVVKAYIAKNQISAALETATTALSQFSDSGDKKAEAEANTILFDAYFASGNVAEGLTTLEAAINGFRDLGDAAKESSLLATSSKLCLKEANYAKAQEQAARAMELAKSTEKWSEMLSALECCVKAALASSDGKTAVNSAIEAREAFEQAKLQKMEAQACLLLCDAHLANGKFDRAATAAKAAQEISYGMEDEKGEANALDAMAKVFMAEGTRFDKAARSAEQARRLWKGLEMPIQECNALNVIAQANFNLAMEKERTSGRSDPTVWDKSSKNASEALKIARELSEDEGGDVLTGNSLCIMCEIHLQKKEGKEALACCNEAVGLFLDNDELASGAYSWLLCAQAGIMLEEYHQAQEDAGEGLTLYQEMKDEVGENYAKQILDLIEQLAPPPPPMMMMPPGWDGAMGGMPMGMPSGAKMPTAAAAPPPDAGGGGGGAVAKVGAAGALNLAGGANQETVVKKIQEVSMNIIGDGETIDEDTPLMQAGLTSNTAVLLRDELSGVIPGVGFPPTLIFDYPSIGAIAEYVMEKVG